MLQTIVFNDTSCDEHHGCQFVMAQLGKLSKDAGIQVRRYCPKNYDWESDQQLIAEIATLDLCIVNGEGTMHHDADPALCYGRLARYCRSVGVPCFLINSVWQDNCQLLEYATDFAAIYVRDRMSKEELAASGVSAEVVPDLTFTLAPSVSATREGLVVNGSVLKERQLEALRLVSSASMPLRYLSIRTLPPLRVGRGFKRLAFQGYIKRLKRYRHIAESYLAPGFGRLGKKKMDRLRWRHAVLSGDRFLHALASSEGVITGRFHCVTLCLVTGTPFYAVPSNTHKIEALLEEIGLEKRVFDSYSGALNSCSQLAFTESEKERIEKFKTDARRDAVRMFEEIARRAERRREDHDVSV